MGEYVDKVLLGFTFPAGEPYYLPLHHTGITGMSDLSGKTTASEAIHRRSEIVSKDRKSLIFLTKRGEKTYANAFSISPYYKERFDWEYMRGLLEATMKERLKFETPWIVRISKQTQLEIARQGKSFLAPGEAVQVFRKILGSLLTDERHLKGIDRDMYTLLAAYIDKVLPTLLKVGHKFTSQLTLQPGMNVMNLTEWYTQTEIQMLLIRSCMEKILTDMNNVTLGLPEAWKMLPQGRNTPVKLFFEQFIREGATNGNFLLVDAQDLGGVDKETLRQVSLWLIGKMMQFDEVKRLLAQIPGAERLDIKAETIQKLTLGHFIVVNGIENTITQVYVWPHGVPQEMAIDVAKGKLSPEKVKEWLQTNRPQPTLTLDSGLNSKTETGDVPLPADLAERFTAMERRLDALSQRMDNFSEQFTQQFNAAITEVRNSIPNEEELITKLASRIPRMTGMVSYEVAPLEKLQKDFLEVAKQQIFTEISTLDPDQKKILKFMEAISKGTNITEILGKCLYLSTTSGGTRSRINDKIDGLAALEFVRKDTGGHFYPNLKAKIQKLLEIHNATQAEQDAVYSHILMEMLKEK